MQIAEGPFQWMRAACMWELIANTKEPKKHMNAFFMTQVINLSNDLI
jgi:hypothetical protein